MALLSRLRAAGLCAAIVLGLGACAPSENKSRDATQAPATDTTTAIPKGEGFDFYVLSLSWSPSYCEAEGQQANGQQCRAGRPYAFVVHGLWPQFERGYPRNCPTNDSDLSSDELRGLYDLMPSAGLIRHEWRTHGTCSGLSQDDYFKVLRLARQKVEIPAEFKRLETYRMLAPRQVERAFLQSNPAMQADEIAVTCDRRYLREVRICMTKDLGFRACPEIERRACRLDKVVMPPVRGR